MNIAFLRKTLIAGLSLAVLMASGSAHALFRTYLSVNGNDANPCTVVAPCRLLPAALAATDVGGEVWMVDSANFNTAPVVITKSVTIQAVPGVLGSVVGNNGNAFTIATAGVEVTLQNLNILNFFFGDIGVHVNNAKSVTIINCNIFGFTGAGGLGIWVNPGANAPKLTVIGTTIRKNVHGIVVAGNGRATITRTQFVGNSGAAVWSNAGSGTSVVHVNDSVATGNGTAFAVTGATGANSYMYVTRAVASENTNGFQSDGGGTAYMVVGGSMATNNAVGFLNSSGAPTLWSLGDNIVLGNTTANTSGTITPWGGT